MNPDIRLSTAFFLNRKTRKLHRKLGDHGVLCLLRLWTVVAIEKPSGILSGWDSDDIEIEAEYEGEKGIFTNTLIDIGLLEENDGCYCIHNWKTRQSWVYKSEERGNKARLSRMAKTHRDLYERLVKEGYKEITRTEYEKLTTNQRIVNGALTPAPAPAPSPAPSPSPSPTTLKKEKEGKKKKIFSPPSLQDVKTYCKERGNNLDAEQFINFYQAKGWYVGKNKMKDWRAAVRTWEKRSRRDSQGDWADHDPANKIVNEFTGGCKREPGRNRVG